jgi:hypothetical protein
MVLMESISLKRSQLKAFEVKITKNKTWGLYRKPFYTRNYHDVLKNSCNFCRINPGTWAMKHFATKIMTVVVL